METFDLYLQTWKLETWKPAENLAVPLQLRGEYSDDLSKYPVNFCAGGIWEGDNYTQDETFSIVQAVLSPQRGYTTAK